MYMYAYMYIDVYIYVFVLRDFLLTSLTQPGTDGDTKICQTCDNTHTSNKNAFQATASLLEEP